MVILKLCKISACVIVTSLLLQISNASTAAESCYEAGLEKDTKWCLNNTAKLGSDAKENFHLVSALREGGIRSGDWSGWRNAFTACHILSNKSEAIENMILCDDLLVKRVFEKTRIVYGR